MAITNHERVGRALNLLRDGLYPFMEREMRTVHGDRWLVAASAALPDHYVRNKTPQKVLQEDVSSLLIVMWDQWNNVFKRVLGQSERSLVSELRNIRNDWAHKTTVSTDDAYRALDSITRLLTAVSAPEADPVEKQKQELLRLRFEEQARQQTRKAAIAPTEGQPQAGLKPWREIVTPHPDVASGRFQQAEFAADLWQVYLDEGSDEYRDPSEFYRRTFLTEGLKQLLSNALLRLSNQGGDPVIELQTNFGGGKTHAMLALYHLCNVMQISDLPGMEAIFQETNIEQPPQNVNVAVLVGHKLQPSGITPYRPEHSKQNRPLIKTIWGEMAWQLGGAEGYELVRLADETGTNPGDTLTQLFNRYAPCLILIDEWVAYARQLHNKNDLPSGDFDTQFTFAQTLSESAKNAKNTLLIVSIPASDIEVGGERGKEALERLKNAIGRVESPWRPATAEESFEIVRRRLFETNTDPAFYVDRDAVIRSFRELYRNQKAEFPSECSEADYERRMKAAYPIHPELFDRLYSDWSSLDKFQRTRGVLRLMAKVIHCLWVRNDRGLMIMPAQIPIDDSQVQSELTRYLEDQWLPVIEKDVDGPNSLPFKTDSDNPNLGRYSACRRVTRTIYMGSAPTLRAANRGLDDKQIKLGCVQPGETVATFADALRRLTDQATYLYIDGNRYWISTQPNVNRTAQERASQILEEEYQVWEELIKRLKRDKNRGEFSAIHLAPETSADIPDDLNGGVRLVVLHPQLTHRKKAPESQARRWIEEALNQRGNGPRYCKNTLIFLAPDQMDIENLRQYVAQYLAWDSIIEDKEILNLDNFQNQQAKTKHSQCDQLVDQILNQAYQWLITPDQPHAQDPIDFMEMSLSGPESPIERASRRTCGDNNLLTIFAAKILEMEVLTPYVWPNRNHIDLQELWEYFTKYVYLPRLKNTNVLLDGIKNGVNSTDWSNYFAYATGFDAVKNRYLNLQMGSIIDPKIDSHSLIVNPEIAQAQLDADKPDPPPVIDPPPIINPPPPPPPPQPQGKRFFGTIDLDPIRLNRDVEQITKEIVQHLTKLQDANVKVSLEISADLPHGVSDDITRTVTENCRTLKFKQQGFEDR